VFWKPCSSCWSSRLLRENFYRLPFTPPSLVAKLVLQLVSEPILVFQDSNQSKIQRWHTRNGDRVFGGKNYQMWQRRIVAFLFGKGQILWDVTVNTTYVHLINFLALGSRDMFDTNNKAVDYLFRALC
jgi:hypothetical protein